MLIMHEDSSNYLFLSSDLERLSNACGRIEQELSDILDLVHFAKLPNP